MISVEHHGAHGQTTDDPYDNLPEPIKMIYSREEYLWLSDHEKATLERRECEPEF